MKEDLEKKFKNNTEENESRNRPTCLEFQTKSH